ncbi:MAG: OmcA/MtrC family decaheme c-type cytochrome [Acidobacteria bacterium]|nr:OmcA/MtrC family decaheme c-type cytochrome [Acidobacteriota bacterium]
MLVLAGCLALASSSGDFNEHQKAAYLDPNLVDFVRPGLVIKITGAEILADGTIRARFKLTDPKGLPLDREGVSTPGAISVSFIAATIPAGQSQYTAYTTRVAGPSPITGQSATQAGTDSGGTFNKVAEGEYTYTFGTKAPSSIDRAATHTIGAHGSRDLGEFDLGRQFDDDVFNFVPNGSEVKVVRNIVETKTCNGCHDTLAFHGGSRRSVELCVLCHTAQTTDPDTGNTVNFPVMLHKIHMGARLPSVRAGGKYQIIGNRQSVHDYSDVMFPANLSSEAINCQKCHQPGAKQADNWLTKPSRTVCGSCHDNVNFATGENHAGGLPQVSDNECARCHVPEGELEFDASIKGGHTMSRFSRDVPGTVFDILGVQDGQAGKQPTVRFTVKDKSGNAIPTSQLTRLALVLAGPTSEYTNMITEDALNDSKAAPDGSLTYTFKAKIPDNATGSFAVGIEGYRNAVLLPGTKKEVTVRDAGVNKQFYFALDGGKAEPRRQVVSVDKCNSCHFSLSLHGNNRNRPEQCVMCHNPTMTDAARRPEAQNPAQTINFRTMIHRIHTGKEGTGEFTIFGFGGTAHDFTEVGFPGDRRNCDMCHVNNSQQVPENDKLQPVTNPRGYLDPMGPVASACLGCHTGKSAASHALINTSRLGESCATCHGSNAEFSVNRVHAR